MPVLGNVSADEFDSPVERLLASIANLREHPSSKGAHFYRTSLRRFQAWSDVFRPQLGPEQQDASRLLDKLRKRSGKLRDAKIHLDLIKELRQVNHGEKKKLERRLKERRTSQKRKLKQLLRDSALEVIWPSMRAIDQQPAQTPESVNSYGQASMAVLPLEEYRAFVLRRGKLTPENLHEYRLACKRFRYIAELAGEDVQAKELAKTWHAVQDTIGQWHDYLTLSDVARKVLGNSSLYSRLVQRTEELYVESLRAIEQTERKLINGVSAIPKKEPRRVRSAKRTTSVA